MDASIKDKLIDLVKARLENEDWVGTVEKVDGEPKQLKVITTDKYIIVVEIDEDGTVKIIEEGPDDGEPYPSITLTQLPLEGTENEKIKIKVEAEVEKTSKTKKVTTVRIVKPERMKQEKEYTEGGVIFEVTENGVYTFEAETNMGKTKRKTIEINISKPESDIEITSEPTTPRNTESTGTQNGIAKGPINVEIKYGDSSFEKQYKKETDENWTTVTGTAVNLTASNLSSYTVYTYYVTVSDGKATTTRKTVTTGTGNTCYGPFTTSVTCTSASRCTGPFTTTQTCNSATSKTVVCGTYTAIGQDTSTTASCGHTKVIVKYKCSNCGAQTTITSPGCTNGNCSNYNTTMSSVGNHTKTQYVCSTHNYTGTSKSHTYTTSKACSHGNTSSHYYCSTHEYNGSSSSHTYSVATNCKHEKTSTHSYCSHGNTTLHYPN